MKTSRRIFLQTLLKSVSTLLLSTQYTGFNDTKNHLSFISQRQVEALPTVNGDDWWLPNTVKRTINSGFYDVYSPEMRPNAITLTLTWRSLNPKEGIYDWQALENALSIVAKYQSESVDGLWLRIFASDAIHCPEWLAVKYPDLKPVPIADPQYAAYPDTLTGISPGNFYPIWDQRFTAEFKRFLQEFKRRNFAAHPRLIFMYVPGAWRWNEWEALLINELNRQKITPAQFLEWFEGHLNDYADAFEGYVQKLVYTGVPFLEHCEGNRIWQESLNDIAEMRNRMTDIAVRSGMSVRAGGLEFYNRFVNIPSWGAPGVVIDGGVYQTIDETNPLQQDVHRVIATENEAIGDPNMIPNSNHYDYMRMVTLKSLQLRMNWLNMQLAGYRLAPEMLEYARSTLGKRIEDTPDAWVALREWTDTTRLINPTAPIEAASILPCRNWERWLIQREVEPNGHSVAVMPTFSADALIYLAQGISEDEFQRHYLNLEARRTDHNSKSDYLYFALDPRFSDAVHYQIKVTYFDNFAGIWWLEYDGEKSVYQRSQQQINQNDNIWKTVTFKIDDAKFNKRQFGQMDFRLYNGGFNDLTVKFVRVIR